MSDIENPETGNYVVYQPESDKPITRQYSSKRQAEHVANDMAARFPGKKFLIMQEVSSHIVLNKQTDVTEVNWGDLKLGDNPG